MLEGLSRDILPTATGSRGHECCSPAQLLLQKWYLGAASSELRGGISWAPRGIGELGPRQWVLWIPGGCSAGRTLASQAEGRFPRVSDTHEAGASPALRSARTTGQELPQTCGAELPDAPQSTADVWGVNPRVRGGLRERVRQRERREGPGLQSLQASPNHHRSALLPCLTRHAFK